MKNFLFCTFLIVMVAACKTDPGFTVTNPTISFLVDHDLSEPVCVGQSVEIVITMRTNQMVGIDRFSIVKNATDTIVNETVVIPNNLIFTLNYGPDSDDLVNGSVDLIVTLVDKDQKVAMETITMDVEAEFGYRMDVMEPMPSWDLVNNSSLSAMDGADVDIFLTYEEEPCGFGCTHYRLTFTSKNATRYYNISPDPVVNAFSNTTKTQDVLDALIGIGGEDELVVWSNFTDDVTANFGAIVTAFPLVIKIRGTEEYAIMDKLPAPFEFIYKKRSELAGQ